MEKRNPWDQPCNYRNNGNCELIKFCSDSAYKYISCVDVRNGSSSNFRISSCRCLCEKDYIRQMFLGFFPKLEEDLPCCQNDIDKK